MVLRTIQSAWSWIGLEATAVLEVNEFGNVLALAKNGCVWRICPEELSCEVVADSEQALAKLKLDPEFAEDWAMTRLVKLAKAKLGPTHQGRCYCLKIPAILGGAYEISNFGTIDLSQLLAFSGDVAEQIKDFPDGTHIQFDWDADSV